MSAAALTPLTTTEIDGASSSGPSPMESCGPNSAKHGQVKKHTQSMKTTKSHERGLRSHQQRPTQQHTVAASLPPLIALFHPRSIGEIYAEQVYLGLTLQSHIRMFCDLISKFHLSEEESIYGESRKVKRQARRQIGILRTQIRLAAEQEKTIFARLGDLLVEARSREALEAARRHTLQQWAGSAQRSQGQGKGQPSPCTSDLNGATAEFVPQKVARDDRADSAIAEAAGSDDGSHEAVGDEYR